MDTTAVIATLNKVLELELSGVVRYTHYSFMIVGLHRIPTVGWLNSQATESLAHAQAAGEMITHFGGHPSLGIGPLPDSRSDDIYVILQESLDHERTGLAVYRELLALVQDRSVLLEEYARQLISDEERHVGEVEKMMRKPGGA